LRLPVAPRLARLDALLAGGLARGLLRFAGLDAGLLLRLAFDRACFTGRFARALLVVASLLARLLLHFKMLEAALPQRLALFDHALALRAGLDAAGLRFSLSARPLLRLLLAALFGLLALLLRLLGAA
jgi:hypothetical protein